MASFCPARFRLKSALPGSLRVRQVPVQRQRGRMVSPCPARFSLLGVLLEYGLRGLFSQVTVDLRLVQTVPVCTHPPLMHSSCMVG